MSESVSISPEGASTKARLRDLYGYLRAHRLPLLAALLLGLVGAAASLVIPLITMQIIDAMMTGQPWAWAVAALVGLFLLEAGVSASEFYLLERTGEAIVRRLRLDLVSHVLGMRMSEYDRLKSGDLLSRVGTDTTLLRAVVTTGSVEGVTGLVTFVGSLVIMSVIDATLLLLVVGTVTVASAGVGLMLVLIRKSTEEAQTAVGALTARLARALGALRTVRAADAGEREGRGIAGKIEQAYRAGLKTAKFDALVTPAMGLATHGSFLLVLGVGGMRVASGATTIADLIAFLLYLMFLVMPMIMVFQAAAAVQKGMGALQRIKECLGLPQERDAPRLTEPAASAVVAADGTPVVEFRNVSFAYAGVPPVLESASFQVAKRCFTAIVGPSGAGKTTIFSLIERFYDADGGTILFNGVDTRLLSRAWLRRRIGYVEQESPVLDGTVRDNILYGAPDASEAELARAIELVNLGELIARLPLGLDTEVGERGVMLSGGQRQRIAIARALLSRPQLLLLDEPTSQLDSVNETALGRALANISAECALVVVAHRLSTVCHADQIIVLEAGRVLDVGRHTELLARCPIYRRLAAKQLVQDDHAALATRPPEARAHV